jgi:hypothetical protein
MEECENKINQVVAVENKFTKKSLLNFLLKKEEFTEDLIKPISKCITDFTQIDFLLELDQTQSLKFFFFLV